MQKYNLSYCQFQSTPKNKEQNCSANLIYLIVGGPCVITWLFLGENLQKFLIQMVLYVFEPEALLLK